MTAAILVRDHFDGSALRLPARQSCDADQSRRRILGLDFALGAGPGACIR